METKGLVKLSRLYAQAYINVSYVDINQEMVKKFEYASKEMKNNHTFMSLFQFFFSDHNNVSKQTTDLIIKKYQLPHSIKNLCYLLGVKKRMHLLPDVLKKIADLYKLKNNIVVWDIVTSHQCEQDELAPVINMLAAKTKSFISSSFNINSSLIAGIRAQSDTLLWEMSIKRSLQLLKQHFKK